MKKELNGDCSFASDHDVVEQGVSECEQLLTVKVPPLFTCIQIRRSILGWLQGLGDMEKITMFLTNYLHMEKYLHNDIFSQHVY